MTLRRAAPAFAALVALAGCAKQPALAPQPAAAAPPVAAPSPLDGTYRGTSTRYQADARTCPGPGLVTLHVLDGAFDYRWSPRVTLQVQVAADGALALSGPGGPLGDISLSGRAGGGRIEGDATSPACAFHFTARKRG